MLNALRISLVILSVGATAGIAQARVGPEKGSLMVIGGGEIDRSVLRKFIELAGGPNALIIDVPTAGGAAKYGAETATTKKLRNAGAKNVLILHTVDRSVADADSFVAPIRKAGAIWFEGGRQWHLVDSYAGTKSEEEFRKVLDRGGVIAGTSAGASIQGSFLVRGAKEGNEAVVAPDYLKGFGYLRDVGIDQHVVARSRLRDIADSVLPRYPNLLGISEDEGTVWFIQKDKAEILGRNKAFAYNGKQTDPGRPFLTLRPGDTYDLANRTLVGRANDGGKLTEQFVDSAFGASLQGKRAAIVVARDGRILINKSYNIPDDSTGTGANRHPTFMPTTTVPQFNLGNLSLPLHAIMAQTTGGRGRLTNRLYTPIGMHQTKMTADGEFQSNVDELYRLELGLEDSQMFVRDTNNVDPDSPGIDTEIGWIADKFDGTPRFSQYAVAGGKRAAFMRLPKRRTTVIILSDSDALDAKALAESFLSKLFM
jgi:cyanophycinase